MVDGFSPIRRSVPGMASTFLASVGERPWLGFFLFSMAHAAIWILLPFALSPNLPLDLIEALTYGREWQLGYDKLPPLTWLLVEIAHPTIGVEAAYFAVGRVAVA